VPYFHPHAVAHVPIGDLCIRRCVYFFACLTSLYQVHRLKRVCVYKSLDVTILSARESCSGIHGIDIQAALRGSPVPQSALQSWPLPKTNFH
jgi:hypothetical protein